MIRRLAAILLLVYSVSFAVYYVYHTMHVEATRREFTAKVGDSF